MSLIKRPSARYYFVHHSFPWNALIHPCGYTATSSPMNVAVFLAPGASLRKYRSRAAPGRARNAFPASAKGLSARRSPPTTRTDR